MKKRRGFVLLLCTAVLAASLPVSVSAAFSDISETAWYAPAVEYVQENGIMNGEGEDRFDPEGKMTRAMFVQALYRMTENRDSSFMGYWYDFSDVDPSLWYSESSRWAYLTGVANGCGDNLFEPMQPVTREQMAQFLYRYAERTGNELSGFPEKPLPADFQEASAGAREALAWAWSCGILRGEPGGKVRPRSGATRAEAAQLLSNAAPLLENRMVRPYARENKEAAQWGLTGENYPRVDGSTSTLGLVQSAFETMHQSWESSLYPETASRTVPSYEKLIAGEVDLILVPYASADVLHVAEQAGVGLEFHKVALEALVFITRSDNPTESITQEQAVSIYRDYAIRNWKELGGPDKELVPICRNANSGSQSQMDNLVLNGQAMHPEIEENYVELTMPGMLYQVANFQFGGIGGEPRDCYALGYTLFAYLSNYREDPSGGVTEKLKMLSYNGVAPTEESLKDGSYPLTDGYYAVLRKDTPEDAPARKLLAWFQSDSAAPVIRSEGFLPAA